MTRFIPLLVSLLLLWAMPPAFAKADSAASKVILFYGDSLSAAYGIRPELGWVALAQPEIKRAGFAVINASVSGETTAGGLTRLPALLKKHRPALLVLALGANDGLRGLDPMQMQKNLVAMVQMAEQHNCRVLLIGIRIPPNFGLEYTAAFDAVFANVAKLKTLPLVPFLLAPIQTDRSAFQSDALHPTAAAQAKIWQHVRPVLLHAVKALAVTSSK
jgi:acyl-CoA thioesterase I